LISGILNSEALEWTAMTSLPPVACFTPSANFSTFTVWKLPGA
jgi:hypothetical protein